MKPDTGVNRTGKPDTTPDTRRFTARSGRWLAELAVLLMVAFACTSPQPQGEAGAPDLSPEGGGHSQVAVYDLQAEETFFYWEMLQAPSLSGLLPGQSTDIQRSGRPIPPLRNAQPRVDPALPEFRPKHAPEMAASYTICCSDTMPSLVKEWIRSFQSHYPNVELDLAPPYTGSVATKQMIAGELDLVILAREPRGTDRMEFQAVYGYDMTTVPICSGAYSDDGFADTVVFVVHRDNPIDHLTFKQLDAIFSKTGYRGGRMLDTWGEFGLTGEWEEQPIVKYGVQSWNSVEEYLRGAILNADGQAGKWRDDVLLEETARPVSGNVASDRYAIGYGVLSSLDAGVKVLAVGEDDGGPWYSPTFENVVSGRYPLSRKITLNFGKAPGEALPAPLTEFVRFLLSRQAAEIVVEQGVFLPLTAAQADRARSVLQLPRDDIAVVVNGVTHALSKPPLTIGQMVYLPLEATINALNGTVEYDHATGVHTIRTGSGVFRTIIGSHTVEGEGQEHELEITSRNIGDVAYVPLEYIPLLSGMSAEYRQDQNAVSITTR